jgi:hypothetical protein
MNLNAALAQASSMDNQQPPGRFLWLKNKNSFYYLSSNPELTLIIL